MLNQQLKQFSTSVDNFSNELSKYHHFKDSYPKYKNLVNLKSIVAESKLKNKKISFVSGNFNVIHPGHLRRLKFAKEISDILIVYINPDKNSNSMVSKQERMESMQALTLVDFLVNEDITIKK